MVKLKRLAAPRDWPIVRKTKKRYVLRTAPGPHNREQSLPLGVLLRDVLGCVENMREAKLLLNSRKITIDNRVRCDPHFPVGLMDVLCIGSECYRLLLLPTGFRLHPISSDEAKVKLLKVINKCSVRGNKQQITAHDGRTLLVQETNIKTGDVLVFDLKENKIKEVIKLAPGVLVLITKGRNMGLVGTLEELIITKSSQPNRVRLKINQRSIETLKDYVFAIGSKNPIISLPGV
jgi:small subunit ribosomal protein S4e